MSKVSHLALVVALVFGCCGLAGKLGADTKACTAPPSKTTPHRFESAIVAFEKWDRQNSWPKDAALFVGSSSVRLWQTADSFPDLPVINRGFGGSTIADVNHFFDRVVAKYEPKVIVLYSGDNDIAGGKSPQEVLVDFETFVGKVQSKLPDTRILVVAIKPSIARQKQWPRMKQTNALIKERADENDQIEFVDIAAPMLSDGELPPKRLFIKDGLHLSDDGYQLWNRTLESQLNAAMR